MIWLVWRQQRVPLLVALGLVALVGVAALVGRPVALSTADALGFTPCLLTGAQDPVCGGWWNFFGTYRSFVEGLQLAVIAVPVVAGAVAGAGVFGTDAAREAHGFSLAQSASRLRWWATSLLVSGLPVAVATVLVTPAVDWSNAPFTDTFTNGGGPLQPQEFVSSGLMPTAYAVLAFCLAAGAGLLLRNALGALGLALVAVALVLGTTTAVRMDHLPSTTVYRAIPPPGAQESPWVFPPESHTVDTGFVHEDGREIGSLDAGVDTCNTGRPWRDCMASLGLTGEYARYQPAERYWPLQIIESAIVLALAAGALAAGLVRLRRRVH